LVWARPRSTRTVLESGKTVGPIARPPFVGALPGDVHRLSRGDDGPAGFDALTEPPAALGCEWGVTVQGEPPVVCVLPRQLHTRPGGSTHPGPRVNNVPGHNS